MRLVRGRSTPAIRAIAYPCLCLCFAFVQITRTTPRRRTTLHLSQIRLTDALTFMSPYAFLRLLQNPPAAEVARRQLDDHLVADEHAHEIPLGPAAEVRGNPPPLDVHVVQATGQLPGHRSGDQS